MFIQICGKTAFSFWSHYGKIIIPRMRNGKRMSFGWNKMLQRRNLRTPQIMNKTELKTLLDEIGVYPSKRLGQCFLIDENMLNFICRTASPKKGELIVEVGPGLGVLTEKLIESGADVLAVEYDKRLVDYLSGKFNKPNFRLISGDACKIELIPLLCEFRGTLLSQCPQWRCISNLPYSISSPFIAEIIKLSHPPSDMFFMLQREVGERFAAMPNTKQYGALSVAVQSMFELKALRIVPSQVFFPEPEVDSAIIHLTLKENRPERDDFLKLFRIAKLAFSHRRKTLFNNLFGTYGKEKTLEIFAKLDISSYARAENLDINKFIRLSLEINRDRQR